MGKKNTNKYNYLLFIHPDKYWTGPDDPIFFYAGNEGPIEGFWDATGFVHEYAPDFKALVIFPEHVSTY